jgi:hypothetical protein
VPLELNASPLWTTILSAMILTYRYRIKDRTSRRHLAALARAVNVVWNFCGETQEACRRQDKPWPSAFDLMKLTSGSSQMLGLHSDTVQAVCMQFAVNRDKAKHRPRWRGQRALGWIPFWAARAIKIDGDAVIYLKRRYRFCNSQPIDGAIKTGCFAQDGRGRWYISLQVEVEDTKTGGSGAVAIDRGLRTLSDGTKSEKAALSRRDRCRIWRSAPPPSSRRAPSVRQPATRFDRCSVRPVGTGRARSKPTTRGLTE